MDEQLFLLLVRKILEIEVTNNIKHFDSVSKNGWTVQFSKVHDHTLISFKSDTTGQFIIRYFTDEQKVIEYAQKVVRSDSTKEQKIY